MHKFSMETYREVKQFAEDNIHADVTVLYCEHCISIGLEVSLIDPTHLGITIGELSFKTLSKLSEMCDTEDIEISGFTDDPFDSISIRIAK